MAAETEPEQADVVAFILAYLRGDEVGCRSLLASADPVALCSDVVDVTVGLACQWLPGGRAEFERMLTSWQARRRDSL